MIRASHPELCLRELMSGRNRVNLCHVQLTTAGERDKASFLSYRECHRKSLENNTLSPPDLSCSTWQTLLYFSSSSLLLCREHKPTWQQASCLFPSSAKTKPLLEYSDQNKVHRERDFLSLSWQPREQPEAAAFTDSIQHRAGNPTRATRKNQGLNIKGSDWKTWKTKLSLFSDKVITHRDHARTVEIALS